MGMSNQSRYRLLCQIAQIKWEEHPTGAFVTLTYPDELAKDTFGKMTSQRHQIMRWIETKVGHQVPILWRKEWQVRKSGEFIGMLAPHWHMAVLSDMAAASVGVNSAWTSIIGAKRRIQTDVQPLRSGQHAAMYLAKYLSKEEVGLSVLDNAAYLNMPGRAWGWHRRNLVKLRALHEVAFLTEEEYQQLLEFAKTLRGKGDDDIAQAITILGPNAQLLWEKIVELGLDRWRHTR